MRNEITVFLVFFLCILSTSSVVHAFWTSSQLGYTDAGSDETAADSHLAQAIENYSKITLFGVPYNWYGSQTTTSAIYEASGGIDSAAVSSIAFYIGEGNYQYNLLLENQYYIANSKMQQVWDSDINGQANHCPLKFLMLWSCWQGYERGGIHPISGVPYGMPYCWLHSDSLSLDGYANPDGNGLAFIGWTKSAPWLTRTVDTGSTSDFISCFYFAALCCGNDFTVNQALDYASNKAFGHLKFSDTVFYKGWTHPVDPPVYVETSYMKVYGDGGMHITYNHPLFGMKTRTDGYFYCPSQPGVFHVDWMKIETWFNDELLSGDQTGLYASQSPYLEIPNPDSCPNMRDISFMIQKFNLHEGFTGWDYMADAIPDKVIDMRDIALVNAHFNHHGTYYTDLAGLQVTFHYGTGQNIVETPDFDGFIQYHNGADNFTVTRNGNPVGAWLTFWEST